MKMYHLFYILLHILLYDFVKKKKKKCHNLTSLKDKSFVILHSLDKNKMVRIHIFFLLFTIIRWEEYQYQISINNKDTNFGSHAFIAVYVLFSYVLKNLTPLFNNSHEILLYFRHKSWLIVSVSSFTCSPCWVLHFPPLQMSSIVQVDGLFVLGLLKCGCLRASI